MAPARMYRESPGELPRIADELFRALDRLGPGGAHQRLDLSRCDALTPETDVEHLILQGKLCVQRLYALGLHHPNHDQDAVFVMASVADMVLSRIVDIVQSGPDELRRLNEAWARLQGVAMELERRYAREER